MLKQKKVFVNPFSDKKITHECLVSFANDVIIRLTKPANGTQYKDVVAQLTLVVNTLQKDLDDINNSSTQKQNEVQACTQLKDKVKSIMIGKKGAISHFLGGTDSQGYMAFYPKGTDEYSRITKAKLPALIKRIKTETETYGASMDDNLRNTLKSFGNGWVDASGKLTVLKSDITDEQTKLLADRITLENTLLDVVHTVSKMLDNDEQQYAALFDSTLLYVKTKSRRKSKVSTTTTTPPPPTPEA